MADQRTAELPDGTDTIIQGAAEPESSGAIATDRIGDDEGGTTLTIERDALEADTAKSSGRLSDRLRSGREQLAGQAGDKARGLVTQGLERTAEALANVSKMVG